MIRSNRAWLGLLLIHLVVSDDAEYCVYKGCYCMYGTIDCENLKLTEIPQTLANITGYSTLNLNDNHISIIPSGRLPHNMSEIDFQDNPISSIDDAAFDGSTSSLKTLVFSSVLFQKIPDAFLRLTSLESLTITNSNIQDWNEEVMINIGRTLITINLDNVSLTSWPTWIQHLSRLTTLSVINCRFSSMPDDAFDNVANSLGTLSLYNNRLTEVPKALAKLQVLQALFLHNNTITDVTWLPKQSNLTTLWLNENRIKDANMLSNALRPYGDSLLGLDIHDNQLTSIPHCSFLTRIGYLDLSHNRISDPYSGSVYPNLSDIDLSYNSLQTIPPIVTTLHQMNIILIPWNAIKVITSTSVPGWVSMLEFGFNLISELTDNSFPQDSQIVTLHLNNNPIVKISNLAFQNTPLLRELNLQSTRLKRLPLALGSVTALTYFDMTGSNDLVCTCMENSLKQWVLSQSPQSVVGNCGKTSIYEFFSQLSSDCP